MAPARSTARKATGDATEPAPSNPASLLWAHQLKREHGFLLDRMHKIESEVQAISARTRSVAATAADMTGTIKDVNKLKEDMADIISSDRDTGNWISSTKSHLQKIEQDIERANHLHPRLSDMETVIGGLGSEVREASSQQQSIMERIQKAEVTLQEKCSEIGGLVKANYQNDARDLKYRLDAIESQCKKEREQVNKMQDKIDSLKQTLQKHSASNTELNASTGAALFARDQSLLPTEASTIRLRTLNIGHQQALTRPLSRQMDML